MKYLIVYAHPNLKSYNNAILEILTNKLKSKNHEVKVRDLYVNNFNPVLSGSDFEQFMQGQVPDDIKTEQQYISDADVLVFQFPIWWFQMPAILKGYIDQVFSKGFAYDIGPDGVFGLLNGKKCILINTTGGTAEQYNDYGFLEGITRTIDAGNFQFCGMKILLMKNWKY